MNEKHTGTRKRSNAHKVIVTISVAAAATLAFCALTWAVDDEYRDYRRHDGMRSEAMMGGPMLSGGKMHRFMLKALDRHLDLSEEQYATIEQILDDSGAEGQALRAEIQPLFEQIRASVEQDGFDEDEVRILLENQSPRMIDMMILRIRTMADIRAQLKPEQQAAAQELFDSRRGRFTH